MIKIRIFDTLDDLNITAWNNCFSDGIEDYDYLLTVEKSGIENFIWRYVTLWENNVLIAAMPAFLTNYALDSTLSGQSRKVTNWVRKIFPGFLHIKLACLGSPCTDQGIVGFHPGIKEHRKQNLLLHLVTAFEEHAMESGHPLIGIKDIPTYQEALWALVLTGKNYQALPSLPIATIDINFIDINEYFNTLSANTRKNLRRKWRSSDHIRVEYSNCINGRVPDIMKLYFDTYERADMKFEKLTADFFVNILAQCKGQAFYALYFVKEELLAVNLLIRDGKTLLDKYFLMDKMRGRENNLYFFSWMMNIKYCIDHHITRYQSGQALSDEKLRLGSRLVGTKIYFRHTNSFLQRLLVWIAPFLIDDTILKEAA